MLHQLILVALGLLVAAEIAVLWRVIWGPGMVERLLAASLGVNLLTFILATAGALKGSEFYYDAALAAALLSFASTIILAKFIAQRRIL